jgi:hypothetical protein
MPSDLPPSLKLRRPSELVAPAKPWRSPDPRVDTGSRKTRQNNSLELLVLIQSEPKMLCWRIAVLRA